MNPGWRTSYLRYKSYFLNVVEHYKTHEDLRSYLEIIFSLITISIFSVFALRPTLNTIGSLIKEIETKKETIKKMDEKIQNISRAQTLYEREKSKIMLLKISVPEEAKPDVFTRQVLGLSQKHNVSTSRISTGEGIILGTETMSESQKFKKTLGEKVNSFSFNISAETKLEQYLLLYTFLSEFQKLRITPKLDSLRMSTVASENGKSLILTLDGRLPYFPKEE